MHTANNQERIKKTIRALLDTVNKTEISQAANVSRVQLYVSFSPEGNPRLSTLCQVCDELGIEILLKERQPH